MLSVGKRKAIRTAGVDAASVPYTIPAFRPPWEPWYRTSRTLGA